ncbi:hypothetical protein T492DRAFT_1113924 [Pavlovales sp. CCMP2436]|nr:hypothetical protein T492DRAFT_1113924 [Pavlovales sp. CCMP2436]
MVEELDINLPSAIGDIYLTTAFTAASRIDISNGIGVANIVERLEQQSAHRALRLMESFSLARQTLWSNLEGLAGDKVWSALNNEQQHERFWLRVEFLAFAALSDLGDSTLLAQPSRYFGVRAISATTLSERLRFVYAAHIDERSAEINAIGASRVVRLDFTKTMDELCGFNGCSERKRAVTVAVILTDRLPVTLQAIGIKGGKSTNIAEYTEWLLEISSAPNYTVKIFFIGAQSPTPPPASNAPKY